MKYLTLYVSEDGYADLCFPPSSSFSKALYFCISSWIWWSSSWILPVRDFVVLDLLSTPSGTFTTVSGDGLDVLAGALGLSGAFTTASGDALDVLAGALGLSGAFSVAGFSNHAFQ